MLVRTPEVGDELVLEGDVRIALLGVEGGAVLFEIDLPGPAPTLSLNVFEGSTRRRTAPDARPSEN
jgi:hypothetical protein